MRARPLVLTGHNARWLGQKLPNFAKKLWQYCSTNQMSKQLNIYFCCSRWKMKNKSPDRILGVEVSPAFESGLFTKGFESFYFLFFFLLQSIRRHRSYRHNWTKERWMNRVFITEFNECCIVTHWVNNNFPTTNFFVQGSIKNKDGPLVLEIINVISLLLKNVVL